MTRLSSGCPDFRQEDMTFVRMTRFVILMKIRRTRAFAPPSPKESFGPKGDKILLHCLLFFQNHIPILSDDHRIHNKKTD
jgi:hypothetical protein